MEKQPLLQYYVWRPTQLLEIQQMLKQEISNVDMLWPWRDKY